MKINVTVDLSEFYTDNDDANFSEQIKSDIAYQVQQLVWKSFQENALTSFTNQVEKQISLDKDLKIKELLNEYFSNKKN